MPSRVNLGIRFLIPVGESFLGVEEDEEDEPPSEGGSWSEGALRELSWRL